MSKFEYESYNHYVCHFAINAKKYTKEQAIAILEEETKYRLNDEMDGYAIGKGFVTHQFWYTEDNERQLGWVISIESLSKRSVPVWRFYHNRYKEYEYE